MEQTVKGYQLVTGMEVREPGNMFQPERVKRYSGDGFIQTAATAALVGAASPYPLLSVAASVAGAGSLALFGKSVDDFVLRNGSYGMVRAEMRSGYYLTLLFSIASGMLQGPWVMQLVNRFRSSGRDAKSADSGSIAP